MNRSVNTVLFMVGATLLNLILIGGLFVVLLTFFSLFLDESTSSRVISIAYLVSLLTALGGGLFLYKRIVLWADKRWKLENYISLNKRKRGR
ncbi:MAG: hypothetical protein PQJ60_04970 [Spirochaetales bacterium]|nr:hypothetical protein [Spirochaetales bacterium]